MKKKPQWANAVLAGVVIVIFAVLISVFANANFDISPVSEETTYEDVLNSLKDNPDVGQYANYPAFVDILTEDELQRLRGSEPAVYEDVPAGSYMVVYDGPEDSLLVVYDFSKKEILKIFVVRKLVLGR